MCVWPIWYAILCLKSQNYQLQYFTKRSYTSQKPTVCTCQEAFCPNRNLMSYRWVFLHSSFQCAKYDSPLQRYILLQQILNISCQKSLLDVLLSNLEFNLTISKSLGMPPREDWHDTGKSSIWRCISCWKRGFSNVMLVFSGRRLPAIQVQDVQFAILKKSRISSDPRFRFEDLHKSFIHQQKKYSTQNTTALKFVNMLHLKFSPFYKRRWTGFGNHHLSHEKNPPTFHYTGWLIGILIMAYYIPYITG